MRVLAAAVAAALLLASPTDAAKHVTTNRPFRAGANPSPNPGGAPAPAPVDRWRNHPTPAPGPNAARPPSPHVVAVPGCTTSSACNFNSLANLDDATCTYPEKNYNCDGTCVDGLEEDCEGVCGGNAVCCPATCSSNGVKGLSCDDVGAMLTSGSTSTTCTTLESSGCDCQGCGCGIIVDADGYTVVDGMLADGTTCDKSAKLTLNSQPCTATAQCTASQCKDYCTAASDCSYAGWNTQGGCILYTNCKVTREVATVTTTYRKVTTGGVECGCTWWSCADTACTN